MFKSNCGHENNLHRNPCLSPISVPLAGNDSLSLFLDHAPIPDWTFNAMKHQQQQQKMAKKKKEISLHNADKFSLVIITSIFKAVTRKSWKNLSGNRHKATNYKEQFFCFIFWSTLAFFHGEKSLGCAVSRKPVSYYNWIKRAWNKLDEDFSFWNGLARLGV